MSIAARDHSGTLRQIVGLRMRDAGNVLRTPQQITMRDASNVLRTIFESMAASASPDTVQGYGNSASPVDITTPVAVCTVTGGVAPFTYAWTRTDVPGDSWSIGNSTAAGTDFTSPGVASSAFATFICTVTDDTGATAVTGEITALALNLGSPI